MKYLIWYYHSFWFVLTVIAAVAALAIYAYRAAAKRLIHNIGYSREFSVGAVYAGEKVTLTETIYNPTRIPLLFAGIDGFITSDLKLTEYEDDNRDTMQYFYSEFRIIMPHMKIRRRHEILCRRRGKYTVESVDIYLAGNVRHIVSPATLYVYPAPMKAPLTVPGASRILGDERAFLPLISDPFARSGLREYLPGDPMNMINFKASARTGGFMNGRTVMIYLNLRQSVHTETAVGSANAYSPAKKAMSGAQFDQMVEYALSQTCKLLLSAVRGGYRAGFAVNGECGGSSRNYVRFEPSTGEHHLEGILRYIAGLKTNAGASFPKMLADDLRSGMTGVEAYVFTAYGDPDTEKNIRLLRQAGNSVRVVLMRPDMLGDATDDNA